MKKESNKELAERLRVFFTRKDILESTVGELEAVIEEADARCRWIIGELEQRRAHTTIKQLIAEGILTEHCPLA